MSRILSVNCADINWLYYQKTETTVVVFCILWKVLVPVPVLIPSFGNINCGKIQPILNNCLPTMYTFPGSYNNFNCMDYWFLQKYASCLYYIYVFIVVNDIFHTFIFQKPIFLQHTPVRLCNEIMLFMNFFSWCLVL